MGKKTIGQLGGMGSGTTTTQYYYVTASPMESVQVMNDNSMVLGAVILERRNPYLATSHHEFFEFQDVIKIKNKTTFFS